MGLHRPFFEKSGHKTPVVNAVPPRRLPRDIILSQPSFGSLSPSRPQEASGNSRFQLPVREHSRRRSALVFRSSAELHNKGPKNSAWVDALLCQHRPLKDYSKSKSSKGIGAAKTAPITVPISW